MKIDNMIGIRQSDQLEISKTLMFKDVFLIDSAYVRPSIINIKVLMNFTSTLRLLFDLSHENYLLKYSLNRDCTTVRYILEQ